MRTLRTLALLLVVSGIFSCKTAQKKPAGDDGIIEVQFLQMNDVYEITPSASDNTGGLARVATIRQELLAKNPNTITVLAGDFISPSVVGTLKFEGKRIRGKQMVETLNTLGLDWVVFGNHEFDYDDLGDLQARLDESKFMWLGGNVRLKSGTGTQPFFKNKTGGGTEPCPDNHVVTLKDADGTTLNLGVFGVLINTGKKPWAEYTDWMETAKKNYADLDPKTDVVIGLTHLNADDDKKLLAALPQIPLIMGGHEHDNQIHKAGGGVVAKADANAKTVYVHTLRYDKNKKKATVKSELRRVNGSIADEPATAAVIAKWEKIKNESLASSGFDPNKEVTKLSEPLDCREIVMRHSQNKAGDIITRAMNAVAKTKPDCALLNSGSVRVDDILSGTLTELDVVRMLPFGGGLTEVEMRGSLLHKTLDAGWSNKGNGGYLQLYNVRRDEASAQWFVAGKALDDTKIYRVILPDFLLTGNEYNMAFLKASPDAEGKSQNPDVLKFNKPDPKDKNDLRNDIRHAVIAYLRR